MEQKPKAKGMAGKIDITIDEARALVADTALWPLVRDFLWNFAPQVHKSWLEGLGLEEIGMRREVESDLPQVSGLMSSYRVRRFVLSSLGVEACFHAFPKGDWSRILLLDGATLEAIVKWLGALALAEQLRRVTDGKTVRGLKTSLPGIYPEVFGFTAYFGKWKAENAECQMDGGEISRFGGGVLFSILKELPAPLLRRLELKLPKGMQIQDGQPSRNQQFSVFDSQFMAKLLKLRFPEAHKLCC